MGAKPHKPNTSVAIKPTPPLSPFRPDYLNPPTKTHPKGGRWAKWVLEFRCSLQRIGECNQLSPFTASPKRSIRQESLSGKLTCQPS